MKGEPLFDQIERKTPCDEKPLSGRRTNLSRIGSIYMSAREKIAIDPLLLNIEVILVTGSEKSEKNGRFQ